MRPGHSYLLIDTEVPSQYLVSVDPIDRLFFDGADLDIKAARAVVASALGQPFGPIRLLVVVNADQLTNQVQNTFLKLLEEPPVFLVVILATKRPQALLPTVHSRLHQLGGRQTETQVITRENSPPTSEELRAKVDRVKDRQGLVVTIESVREVVKSTLLTHPSRALVEAHNLLDRSVRRLNQNANQKLVIDSLLLNWPL